MKKLMKRITRWLCHNGFHQWHEGAMAVKAKASKYRCCHGCGRVETRQ